MSKDTQKKIIYKLPAVICSALLALVIFSAALVPTFLKSEMEAAEPPAQTTELTVGTEPLKQLPTPAPVARAAYIPDIDELTAIPSFEELLTAGDFSRADIDEEGTLSLLWNQSGAADYYLLYALDENGGALQTEILWPNTGGWNFGNFIGAAVMLLGYKDMGEDGMEDDTVVYSLVKHFELSPEETPEFTEGAKSTPKPPAAPKPPAKPNKHYIIVDKSKFTFAIFEYEEETRAYTKRVNQFPCALGGSATPSGKFKIGTKGEWKKWSSTSFSPYHTRYANGLYFHGPLYKIKGDFGSLKPESYNQIGTNASHGCIRTTVAGALWVYKNCKAGTVVEIVKSSDKVSKATKLSIDPDFPAWDPTDPRKPEKPAPTPTPAPTPEDGGDGGGDSEV